MALLVAGAALLLVYATLIFYYFFHWLKLKDFKTPEEIRLAFISLLIPARNESENIGQLLNAIRRQSLPLDHFEVIVIDDHSTDDTVEKVKAAGLSNLTLIRPGIPAHLSSKKKAIEAGINIARGELIITTDADCLPPPEWLEAMSAFYVQSGAVFIAAPVKYNYHKKFIEQFQALDFLVLQGITAAAVSSGLHTLCNGANLAYKASAFRKVNGFEGIDRVATGDDMLLMYKIGQQFPGQLRFLKSHDAMVVTSPVKTWKDFISQRKRWVSKTPVFRDRWVQLILLLVYLFHLMFPVLLAAGWWHHEYFLYAAGLLVVKTLVEIPFVRSVAKFYGEEKLMPLFPLFQPVHIFYTVMIGIISQAGQYEWKGRKTK